MNNASLYTTDENEIRIDQSGFRRREKLYWAYVNVMLTGKAWQLGNFFALEAAKNFHEKGFIIPKT